MSRCIGNSLDLIACELNEWIEEWRFVVKKIEAEFMPRTAAKSKSCEECRLSKKGCNKDPNGCYSCRNKGVPCVYLSQRRTEPVEGWISGTTKILDMPPSHSSMQIAVLGQDNNNWSDHSDESQTPGSQWTPDSLQLQMYTMEMSLIEQEASNWDIQDPDLMPTINDWYLCYRYLTKGGTIPYPQSISHDAEAFMRNFFSLPPVYRLIKCAMYAQAFLLKDEALAYYKRARKAFLKIGFAPTVEDFHSSTYVAHFAYMSGQPVIGIQFLKRGITFLKKLKLNIDPDESPWLFHLNLSPRQKEDRRRAFWIWYSIFTFYQGVCNNDSSLLDVDIDWVTMKPPSQVYDPYPIFSPIPTRQSECQNTELLVRLKKWRAVPPSTIHSLLTDPRTIEFSQRQDFIRASTPVEVMLYTKHLDTIDTEEEVELVNQIISSQDDRVVAMNMSFETAQSAIHRPILYISSLRSYHPLLLNHQPRHIIANAITKCVNSAMRVATLCNLYKALRKWNFALSPMNYAIESYIECFMVVWFVMCKMEPAWWEFTDARIKDFSMLRMRMEEMAQTVRALESGPGGGGYFAPIMVCMNAMLKEIDHVQEFGRGGSNDGVNEIELGMRIVSIGGVNDVQEAQATEPYILLGLLGLEVAGGLRFKGRTEESWRLFWKLNG